jgi:hypothetical protein
MYIPALSKRERKTLLKRWTSKLCSLEQILRIKRRDTLLEATYTYSNLWDIFSSRKKLHEKFKVEGVHFDILSCLRNSTWFKGSHFCYLIISHEVLKGHMRPRKSEKVPIFIIFLKTVNIDING